MFPQSDDISRAYSPRDRLFRTGDIFFGERILFDRRKIQKINFIGELRDDYNKELCFNDI